MSEESILNEILLLPMNIDANGWAQVHIPPGHLARARAATKKDHGLDSDYPETKPLHESEGC